MKITTKLPFLLAATSGILSLQLLGCNSSEGKKTAIPRNGITAPLQKNRSLPKPGISTTDTARYDSIMQHLVHHKPSAKWPVAGPPPLPGALLPYKRIVAYYGNFYSAGMGVLGEYNTDTMLQKLLSETKKWQAADTTLQAIPAIHYIAITAQRKPGRDGKYRARMPADQVEKAIALAQKINGIVFLDVQVGWSTVMDEVPTLEKYLSLPNVHLGIDPEYSMKGHQVPCAAIGTFDAADVNWTSGYLAGIVKKYNLPPKVLIVHRFTREMLTNAANVQRTPEVQLIINMDGFGFPAKKVNSYKLAVVNEPVQFAGFKLFYKIDAERGHKRMMTTDEVLQLYPSPVYIQYQ